jgi:formiminotetrahydrofolate cyclodeaminase
VSLLPLTHKKKIIEYKVAQNGKFLKDYSVKAFLNELGSESPAPGGGSVAALCGALSASLSSMVANLSFDKKRTGKQLNRRWKKTAIAAQDLKKKLLHLIDEDMQAFNSILEARRLPKSSDQEKEKT